MTIYEWILIIIALIAFYAIYKILKFFIWSDSSETDFFTIGKHGENYVVDTLNSWAANHNLQAKAYLYETPANQIQKIDVIFESENHHTVGIEVKFRNVDPDAYLKMELLSRYHRDGYRQHSKQLYQYIKPNNFLGLYAFVIFYDGFPKLYFLPHYILDKMIQRNKEVLQVAEIISHPNSFIWNDFGTSFLYYIETEFNNQHRFLYPEEYKTSFFGKIKTAIFN